MNDKDMPRPLKAMEERINAKLQALADAFAQMAKPQGHYKEWCRDPSLCAGKGYCPRDPNCAD